MTLATVGRTGAMQPYANPTWDFLVSPTSCSQALNLSIARHAAEWRCHCHLSTQPAAQFWWTNGWPNHQDKIHEKWTAKITGQKQSEICKISDLVMSKKPFHSTKCPPYFQFQACWVLRCQGMKRWLEQLHRQIHTSFASVHGSFEKIRQPEPTLTQA